MVKALDLIGKVFSRLSVIEFVGSRREGGSKKRYWLCRCSCGSSIEVVTSSLLSGNSKSCGCVAREKNTKHGMWKSKIYQVWADMKTRCNNPDNPSYKNYGGRGITYCKEWENFENFFKDMGGSYSDKLTLERIDVNGMYHKNNCSWVSMCSQSKNRRKPRDNTSGVTGVRKWVDKKTGVIYHVASWVEYPVKKKKEKHFGEKKYGEELAFFLACEYRDLMILRLNLLGAGYSEGHGK